MRAIVILSVCLAGCAGPGPSYEQLQQAQQVLQNWEAQRRPAPQALPTLPTVCRSVVIGKSIETVCR